MKLGDAFTMAIPPRFQISHLFFVVSDPLKHDAGFVVVNITTNHIRAGEECVLDVGDHPWIQKRSFLSFRDALLVDAKKAASIQGLVGTLVAVKNSRTRMARQRDGPFVKAASSLIKRRGAPGR